MHPHISPENRLIGTGSARSASDVQEDGVFIQIPSRTLYANSAICMYGALYADSRTQVFDRQVALELAVGLEAAPSFKKRVVMEL
jgi:hypothetical protein